MKNTKFYNPYFNIMINQINPVFCILFFALFSSAQSTAQSRNLSRDAQQAMLKASRYMVEDVSTHGGYVRLYLPDFSRRWGELELYKTQIEVQGPTPDMGHLFLDAYGATRNEYYYNAAEKVAQALIWGQLPSGGWNYFIDFAGDRSLKRWYQTIGKNAWGFEEYNHYYGNATLDDEASSGAAGFLLRVYLEKLNPAFRPALDKAIDFFLESQYPLGGWPQRYPLMYEYSKKGKSDYTSFYTFNDNVTQGSIDFLIQCYVTLGQERLLDPIRRGMNFYLLTQQGNPQGGWGVQYNMELEPAHARSYEPAALSTAYTYSHAMLLLEFYRYTGDRKFLARIPDAIDWLERTRLSKEATEGGSRTHPYVVEVGSNRPLYPHRSGSGVNDGHYWVDYSDKNAYRFGYNTNLDIDQLKQEYERVKALSPEEATKDSPLAAGQFQGDRNAQDYLNLNLGPASEAPEDAQVRTTINALDEQGRWLTRHEWISNPYSVSETGEEANTALHSNKITAEGIRDASDQSYISIPEYIKNMRLLINYIEQSKN